MTTRDFHRAVLVISVIGLVSGSNVLAQTVAPTTSNRELQVDPTEGSESAASSPPATQSKQSASPKQSESPAAGYGDAPPPGTEVRIVVAGESEAAAAYASGDSVTGFSAADVEALGAMSVADLASFTPNLEIVTVGATSPTFFIRGVGLNDFNANASGAVAIFQDDVAINAPAMQLSTLYDVEDVQIYRGPVGTGAARNASAGMIRLYSRKPSGTYNSYLRSSFGNYGLKDFEGAVEAPIYEDILLGRLAFRATTRDGYQKNACGGFTAYPAALRTRPRDGATDPAYSLCGEFVPTRGIQLPDGTLATGQSLMPLNQPTAVNNLDNWAARGTLRFQPTLDQDWVWNGHVAIRDELSRQGIAYGTRGTQFYPDGSTVSGRLGTQEGRSVGAGFVRPEVTNMINQQSAWLQSQGMGVANAIDAAGIQVANDIGANLDYDPYTGYYNGVGTTDNTTYGTVLKGDIALLDSLTLKSVSGYDAYVRALSSDTDQSPNTLFHVKSQDQGWQFYQSLGLEGVVGDLPLTWDLGGFYLQEGLDVAIQNDFGFIGALGITDRAYTQDTKSFGVYAGFEWLFWDDFKLDGGIRYNWEDKTIDYRLFNTNQPVSAYRNEVRDSPTGEVRLTYSFRDDTHAYWKYTHGWKGGHFNATSPLNPSEGVTYAEPEANNAWETGVRGSWFDSRVGFETSFFYYDYSNYQLFTVQNSSGATPEFVVINAAGVQVYGAEAVVNTRPWDSTRLQARFSWLESSFTDFVLKNVVVENPPGSPFQVDRVRDINFTGNRLVNSPQFKISMTAEQTVQLGRYGSLTARYDVAWTDTVYFDATEGRGLPNPQGETFLPADTIGQQPYWLHNLIFIYRPPIQHISLEFFVRNVSDEIYKTFAFDATVFQATTIYFTGEPRMFGTTIAVNF